MNSQARNLLMSKIYFRPTMDGNGWKQRHVDGCSNPLKNEEVVLNQLFALANMIDLEWIDHYSMPAVVGLIESIRLCLNYDMGRLDCGTLSTGLEALCDFIGYSTDIGEWDHGAPYWKQLDSEEELEFNNA